MRFIEGGLASPAARLASALILLLGLTACSSPAVAPAEPGVLAPARVAEIIASPDRSAADRVNDKRRKPDEMLNFIAIRPGMVALDVSAGGGYTTELLARAVGPTGRVYGQSPPRARGRRRPHQRSAPPGACFVDGLGAGAGRARVLPRSRSPSVRRNPNASNIVAVVQPFENPVPAEVASNGLDLVTLMFNYHDLGWMNVDRARMNRAIFAALKPGGMYVIADHAGRAGTGISESGTLHRVEEAFVRSEVESAGFRLRETGYFLRNPNDPRDRNTPDPPQPKDEFVLKFVKP